MNVLFIKKLTNKETKNLIIRNNNNENEFFKLILKKKENNIIIKLIELQEKLNENKEKYYINKSNNYYLGEFKSDDIKNLLSKLNINNSKKKNIKLDITQKNKNIIKLENLILNEKNDFKYKENPSEEEYKLFPIFKNKEILYNREKFKNYETNVFELFYYNKYFNEPCLILIEKKLNQINIIRLIDNKILLSINLPKNSFKMYDYFNQTPPVLKHYFLEKHNYLIYGFKNYMLIYDLSLNCKKYEIKTSQKFYIEQCLLIKNVNKSNYLILNQNNSYILNNQLLAGEKSKVYNFKNGKFINDINNTEMDICFNIIYWKDEYIVKFCCNYIKIINFINSQIYHQFNTNLNVLNDNIDYFGYINKNNILLVFSKNFNVNTIKFYDLEKKLLIKSIDIHLNSLTLLEDIGVAKNLLKWNDNIIIINCNSKIIIIDINNMQIINVINNVGANNIKKIEHPKYGRCLFILLKKNI